jgi:hypothetical protein
MKALSVAIAHALSVCTVLVFLGSCGGPQSQSAGAVPESGVSYARHDGSWINPNVINSVALIYVSSSYPNDRVFIYNYPQGRLQGEITGFLQPAGQCVDAKGDVYIANSGASSVVEIPRGGKNPIKTLGANGFPIGCAVSPNGDLAVANSFTPGAQDGNIQVFKARREFQNNTTIAIASSFFHPATTKMGTCLRSAMIPLKSQRRLRIFLPAATPCRSLCSSRRFPNRAALCGTASISR